MSLTLLQDFSCQIDAGQLLKRLHMDPGTAYADQIEALAKEAQEIAKPRALYRTAQIDSKQDNAVLVEGVTLSSRVLRVNVDGVHRVFPYVVTCGMELEDWGNSIDDPLMNFAAEAIQEMVLGAAITNLFEHMKTQLSAGHLGTMNPGSLADWPLPEQRHLFALLGDVEGLTGIKLLESFVMIPKKSVSGLRFPTESTYENCQLCEMPKCPGRRAPFEKGLYERKYGR